MYVLHIANKNYSSWSLRPWVLLTQLGIPFEERLHIFPSDGPSYPEFSKFSPTGFVPVLDDGDIKVSPRFDQEDLPHVRVTAADRLHDADLARAFENRHDHGVHDAK